MTKVALCKLHPAGGGHPTVDVARASNRKDLNFFEKRMPDPKKAAILYGCADYSDTNGKQTPLRVH